MKRDLYDNFFENTELLGKTLEKRFAGEYKLKKIENKEDWRRICPINGFKYHKRILTIFFYVEYIVPWYFREVLNQIKKGRV